MRKEIIVLVTLLIFTIPAVKALFIPGGFTSHDLTHHVIRQISMDKLLSEGQFPPRWSGQLNNGYGYPVFLFNYPLPALVGEIFHKLGFSFVDSVKAVLFLSMVISEVGMYLFLNALLKSRLAAFLGAIFYLYAPIRFLNVYVSAAVGSALALGILPFVFFSLVLISKGDWGDKGNKGIILGGLSLAGLILAHNVTALIFAPVILSFAGFLVWKKREIRVIWEIGAIGVLGLGLSAWFWMPALFEKHYTRFDHIFSSFYLDQFPTLWQLIRSPWGYGLSHPQNPGIGDMSYQVGLIHIGVVLIFIAFWVFRGIREIREIGKNLPAGRQVGGWAVAVFLLSIFLMLKVSLPLWENLPFLSLIQFPLRFQAWSVFSAAILAALLIKHLSWQKLTFTVLLVLVIYANRNHWHINQVFDPGEQYYLNLKTTSTSFGEHLPKWGRIMEQQAPARLEFIRGVGEVRVIKDNSAYFLAEVEATSSSVLRFNQFYFPGWQIKLDGQKVGFDYLSDTESYGFPIFDIESGKHIMRAQFKNTAIRNLADGISIVIFTIMIIFIVRIYLWRKG